MQEWLHRCVAQDFLSCKTRGLSVLTLMGEDAVEIPKEMLGKEGDVYKLSMDTEPSGRNSLGCEGHLCVREADETEQEKKQKKGERDLGGADRQKSQCELFQKSAWAAAIMLICCDEQQSSSLRT